MMNEGKKDGRNETVIFLASDQSDPPTGSHCAQAGCTVFEEQPLSQMASFLGGCVSTTVILKEIKGSHLNCFQNSAKAAGSD